MPTPATFLDLEKEGLSSIWRQDPCAFSYEIARRAPGRDIWLGYGDMHLLFLQDARSAARILRDNPDNYAKYFGSFIDYFGQSRLTSDGPLWRHLRNISQPHLRAVAPQVITKAAFVAFNQAAYELLEKARQTAYLPVDAPLDLAAARVLGDVVLGLPPKAFGPDLVEDMQSLLRASSSQLFPTRQFSVADAMAELDAEDAKGRLGKTISEALAEVAAGDRGSSDGLLAKIAKADDPLLDQVGEVKTLLFAGFDTTSTALGWVLYLLARNPALQGRLREHIRSLKTSGDGTPDAETLACSDLLTNVIRESLRIFPPVPMISRTAKAPDEIGGTIVGANQRVLVSFVGLHLDPEHFPEPTEIRPEGRQVAAGSTTHFLPFSDGRRICPGARFAEIEMAAALVALLTRVEFSLPADKEPLRFRWNASLRREGGQTLLIRPAII
jgi:cytochrome P450